MISEAERIAGELTEAQRAMLLDAKVGKPLAWLKGYMLVEIDCRGRSADDAAALECAGLVNLPIRAGDRASTLGYSGELLPLGLEVKRILEEKE